MDEGSEWVITQKSLTASPALVHSQSDGSSSRSSGGWFPYCSNLGGLDAVRESAMALAEGKFWRWVDGGGEVLMLEKGWV